MRCSHFTAWHGFSLVEGISTLFPTHLARQFAVDLHLSSTLPNLTPFLSAQFFSSKHLLLFYDHCYPLLLKVIGGELQERLIPVPYSKSSTDQAVSRFPTFFLVRSIDRSYYVETQWSPHDDRFDPHHQHETYFVPLCCGFCLCFPFCLSHSPLHAPSPLAPPSYWQARNLPSLN